LKEHDLYSPLIDGGDMEDWLLYRIADGSAGFKPFDIGGADRHGIAVGLEVKRTKEHPESSGQDPLPWKLFETRQRAWLNEFAHHRCLALVALHYDQTGEIALYHLAGGADDLPRKHYSVGALTLHDKLYRGWRKLAIPRGKFGIPKRVREP
jgi:hypothetical protein